MKPSSFFNFNGVKTLEDMKRILTNTVTNFYSILNKNVGFNDNVDCYVTDFVFKYNVVGHKIPHPLNKIPTGFIIISSSVPATYYNPSAFGTPLIALRPWTDKEIYLNLEKTATYLSTDVYAKIIILGS